MMFSGLTLAQGPKASTDLKQRIKTFKNSGRFSVRYDKFKDITDVSVGPFAISPVKGSVLGMNAEFSFAGQAVQEDLSVVRLVFSSYSAFRGAGWTFVDHRSLYGIIDGDRTELGEGAWKSHVSNLSFEELVFTLPIATIRKIAGAKTVELKVGLVELKLKEEHLIAFKDLLSLTKRE